VDECLLLFEAVGEVDDADDAWWAARACAFFMVAMAAAISLPAAVREDDAFDGGDIMGVVDAARDDDKDDA
jgi:hypothetical protein